MIQEFLEAYGTIVKSITNCRMFNGRGTQKLLAQLVAKKAGQLEEGQNPTKDLVDSVLCIRRSHELLTEYAKALKDAESTLTKILMEEFKLQLDETGVLHSTTVRTDWVTATLKVDKKLPIPSTKSNPELYYSLCQQIGIPAEIAKHGVVEFRWNGLQEWFGQRLEEGKPIPEGISLTELYPYNSITLRQKRDLPISPDFPKEEN